MPMIDWDLPEPHLLRLAAASDDIDGYGHVNNAVYVRWLDRAAWSHSAALGLPAEACARGRRGMVVWRTQINYLAPVFAGDAVEIATWIVRSDGRLRVDRRFQVVRPRDGGTVLRALLHYVCIDLDSGRPRRMPPDFVQRYQPLAATRAAVASQPEPFRPGVEPER